MANVSEQVRQQDDLLEYFEVLATLDDKAEIAEQAEAELLAGVDLPMAIPTESTESFTSFLPDFTNIPTASYIQDQELENLKLAVINHPLVLVTGSILKSGLASKFCQEQPNIHKLWVDASIYSFTDFAHGAIAYFQTTNSTTNPTQAQSQDQTQTANLSIPDDRLIPTLIKLLGSHSCLVVIDQFTLEQTQQKFWLDFLQAWQTSQAQNSAQTINQNQDHNSAIPAQVIITSQVSLGITPELKLAPTLSSSDSADLLTELGVLGDRQDLETFGKLLDGNPLALTLAANLLKAEEQIPQIRYLVRYGKIFDLNHPPNLKLSVQHIFDRSFKRLLPKLRNLLVTASILTQPFNLRDMQDLHGNDTDKIDLADLQKLEKFGLIQALGQNYFFCAPTIKNLVSIPDPKAEHEQVIKHLWAKTKPYIDWESDRDLLPYIAIFQHCCALGEHYRGFYIIHDDTDQCPDRYLELQGQHFQRISLLKLLLSAWRGIQSQRPEFGAVLTGLGDAYSAIHKYTEAVPLYQEWLEILVKRNDLLERKAKAQCLFKLAQALFALANDQVANLQAGNLQASSLQAGNQWLTILPYYQESLEIAVKSSDRPLELHNLLGLGNLYSKVHNYPQALEYYERHLALAQELKDTQAQVEGLPMIANAYAQVKQYPKAIELYRMHLTLVSNYGSSVTLRANSLENLAYIYQTLGEYPEAKINYQECLDLSLDRWESQVICLIGLGICSDRLGQFQEAINYYQQALEINQNSAQNSQNSVEQAKYESECVINLAQAHNSLGQYKEATGFYETSLKRAVFDSDRNLQAKALIGLGNVQNSLGKYVQAIQFYEQAWEISKDIPAQQAIALGNLGNVYNALGQYQEARELYKQSLAMAKEVGNLQQQAHCLHSLGQVLDRLGYYAQALQFYQEWIDLKKVMGDRSATLSSLNRNRSNLAQTSGALASTKYAQAIEFHQQWIEVKRKMGDRQGEANSLGNLGNAFFALGQYPQAIQAYQQCLEIARIIGDRRSEASSLSGLGSAFFVLGQYSQAIEFHERSLLISQKIDDFVIQAKTFSNLGKAYYSLGQYLQAAEKFLTCLEIIQKIGNRQGEANVLGDLGNVHYALGKYIQAIDFYQQWLNISSEIGDRIQQGNALGGLGNSHNALGKYAEAVEFYLQWLNIAQDIGDRRSYANALAGLGNAYNALGEYSRAIEFHQQSLKVQKENSDRFIDKTTWANFAETLDHLEQKSLSANPYKFIDVESTNQDESAIQQLLEAGNIYRDPKPRELPKKLVSKEKSQQKLVPKNTPKSESSGWLNSTFSWLTGKKP